MNVLKHRVQCSKTCDAFPLSKGQLHRPLQICNMWGVQSVRCSQSGRLLGEVSQRRLRELPMTRYGRDMNSLYRVKEGCFATTRSEIQRMYLTGIFILLCLKKPPLNL
jgi:hypothetical protein